MWLILILELMQLKQQWNWSRIARIPNLNRLTSCCSCFNTISSAVFPARFDYTLFMHYTLIVRTLFRQLFFPLVSVIRYSCIVCWLFVGLCCIDMIMTWLWAWFMSLMSLSVVFDSYEWRRNEANQGTAKLIKSHRPNLKHFFLSDFNHLVRGKSPRILHLYEGAPAKKLISTSTQARTNLSRHKVLSYDTCFPAKFVSYEDFQSVLSCSISFI